ncbi:Hypothetical_protein [Hexamita inflata]|uniref:Hypothetical_protein n=1 Tax=Hexamita inflata TaxID=28002 RepID=A0ABP1I8J3_9EUKA
MDTVKILDKQIDEIISIQQLQTIVDSVQYTSNNVDQCSSMLKQLEKSFLKIQLNDPPIKQTVNESIQETMPTQSNLDINEYKEKLQIIIEKKSQLIKNNEISQQTIKDLEEKLLASKQQYQNLEEKYQTTWDKAKNMVIQKLEQTEVNLDNEIESEKEQVNQQEVDDNQYKTE